jgi:non-specific protein-tyrosine kinase
VLIDEAPNNQAADYNAILTNERQAKTYAQMMTTRPVLEGVIQKLDLRLEVAALQDAIIVQPVLDTQLIQVAVENTNPHVAALVANTLVAEFIEQNLAEQAARLEASREKYEAELARMDQQIRETNTELDKLEVGSDHQSERDRLKAALSQHRSTYTSLLQGYEQVRMAEAQSTSTIVQKEQAVPPPQPIRPRVLLNTILASIAGLILAVVIIILAEALNDTLRDPDDVSRLLGLPVLGLVARHKINGKPVAVELPRSPVTESFRSLRTNIQFASLDRPLRTLLVTSPSPEVGKSTVAANLAVVLAQSGSRVVLMDADLRRPKIHRLLNLLNRDGLSSLFLKLRQTKGGSVDLSLHLKLTEVPGLQVITSGGLPPNPAELLGSEHLHSILTHLADVADIVVIDSPPVLAVTDAAVLAPRVDGVLLVVKPGVTKLAACKQAVEQLRRVGANVLGVVLNEVELKRSYYFNYRYKSYSYPYGNQYEDATNLGSGKQPQAKNNAQLT